MAPDTTAADTTAVDPDDRLGQELHGLDVLETPQAPRRPLAQRIWSVTWPKVAAAAIAVAIWQVVVWSGWKPEHVLPGPADVFDTLRTRIADGTIPEATWITMQRAINGFALALVIGVAIGGLVSRVRIARIAFGSFITGLQTMPSIAWFPAAILLFGLNEQAIFFVVVLGAAPSIANGLISGVDHIPPLWLRAGRILGAKGLTLFRHVVLPASLPSFVAGLKQGWAFAWRSLMAGELLVVIANRPSLGFQLQFARELNNARVLYATMLVILCIGIVIDALIFGQLERTIRRRRGLLDET
jgi:NitT/TauT family transport system permease protein